jgi:uncharacterized protein (TIGR00290 family)
MDRRVMVAWSGGKDSAWALHALRGSCRIAGLFTTVDEATRRVPMHEVRIELLQAQADAAGLPLHTIPIPRPCPNAVYERAIAQFIERAVRDGVTHVAFGDLFLEDIRRYRERQFAGSGVELLFPLWGRPTPALAGEMVAGGLRAWITCVDTSRAPREWAGRAFDAAFLAALPAGVDPCGENGEFHSFVVEGPMLRERVRVRPGPPMEAGRFACVDLLPE